MKRKLEPKKVEAPTPGVTPVASADRLLRLRLIAWRSADRTGAPRLRRRQAVSVKLRRYQPRSHSARARAN